MKTRLIFIRHGETDWNAEHRWQGQTDIPLNGRGREQAERTAQALAHSGLNAIYSSDLTRAIDTATALSRATGLAVQLDPRLREIHQGEWQGMLTEEIREQYPETSKERIEDILTTAAPGGEAAFQVQQRMLSAVEDIVSIHSGEPVAIVSHGFAIAVTLVSLHRLPLERLFELIPQNGAWQEIEINS